MQHDGTKTLETERLILRPFKLSDAGDMFSNWANSPAVCRFLSWEPHKSVEATRELLARWVEGYQDGNTYNWVMELKEIGQAIGGVSLVELSEKHQNCELGYCIGERFWGKGLMTEAVGRVIEFLFTDVGLHRVAAKHAAHNPGSGRVMEKCGMVREGTLRQAWLMRDGTYEDTHVWAILREEWEKRSKEGGLL